MDIAERVAALIVEWNATIAGLSGAPGSGKSTLARRVVAERPDAVVISMDDFYFGKAERAERGLTWRGPPGSHDLAALLDVLGRIRDGVTPITIPRFDPKIDDRIKPLVLESTPALTIVEGFYLGYTSDGYGDILRFIDVLIFLDVDIRLAKKRRFAREAELRARGGGFSEEQMQRFWDEVLEPGTRQWTKPARASADVVLSADG